MDSDRIAIKRNVKDTQGKTKTILFYHLVLPSEFAPVLGLSSNSEPFTPPQFDNKQIRNYSTNLLKTVENGKKGRFRTLNMNIATTRYVRCSS